MKHYVSIMLSLLISFVVGAVVAHFLNVPLMLGFCFAEIVLGALANAEVSRRMEQHDKLLLESLEKLVPVSKNPRDS